MNEESRTAAESVNSAADHRTIAQYEISVNELRQRPGDQPLPVEGQENVQDHLIEAIKERRELGVQRYGRPLQTFNGRDAVTDALEEALDLATYLMQVRLEREAQRAGISAALHLHTAEDGLCRTCFAPAPCATRRALIPPHTVEPTA